MADTKKQENEAAGSDSTTGYQDYFVPKYGVSVRARNVTEAVKKAGDAAKKNKEQ